LSRLLKKKEKNNKQTKKKIKEKKIKMMIFYFIVADFLVIQILAFVGFFHIHTQCVITRLHVTANNKQIKAHVMSPAEPFGLPIIARGVFIIYDEHKDPYKITAHKALTYYQNYTNCTCVVFPLRPRPEIQEIRAPNIHLSKFPTTQTHLLLVAIFVCAIVAILTTLMYMFKHAATIIIN
jgi:hypothetical protein